MDHPSDSQIVEALERSGYLFEQDVATLLGNLGFHVETSWAYPDPEQEKSREIDVRAIKEIARNKENKIQMLVELLVECKDFDSPLVFLERRKNERELKHAVPREYLFPNENYSKNIGNNRSREIPAFKYLGLMDKHYYFREDKKATQFSKIVRKKKDWIANHEGIYDSLILPHAKLLEFRRNDVINSSRNNPWKFVWLFFPIVALRDHLYVYDLSGPNRMLERRGRVSFIRHLESEKLKGLYLIDFVTFAHLTDYVTIEVAMFSESISQLVKTNPRILLDRDV